jgi:hypothetical protein
VKPKNSNSVQLSSNNVPSKAEELPKYLDEEIPRLWAAIRALMAGHLDTTYVEPAKPRQGNIILADGTSYDPGSGVGVYVYYSSAWHFLG